MFLAERVLDRSFHFFGSLRQWRSKFDAPTPHARPWLFRVQDGAEKARSRDSEFYRANDLFRRRFLHWAHGVVVSHPLRMRKALGSIPSVSIFVTVQKAGCVAFGDRRASF